MAPGRWTALLAAASFSLSACGSDDEGSNGGTGGSGGAGAEGGLDAGGNDVGLPVERPEDPGWPGGVPLLDGVDRLCTFLLIGPSDAAGYNATLRNGLGVGYGFARLLFGEGPPQQEFAGKDLTSLFPDVRFVDHAESGFTTDEMRAKLEMRIDTIDPGGEGCDTWVHFGNPGNDFNDDPVTIVTADGTAMAAARARDNYGSMIELLRPKLEDPASGRTMVVSISTIQDPTDGTGKIPVEYTEGFCNLIHNPAFTDELRTQAIENLAFFNDEIRAEAAEHGGGVLDQHGALEGHGMNAAHRWLDVDCTHPNDLGHDAIRHYGWYLATGEWLGLP